MDNSEILTLIVSIVALCVSIYAIGETKKSNTIAENANRTNKKMFRRQGVIDLHMAWSEIHDIDEDNLITPHVVRAINALSLTASLWNHDVIEKSILYQSYWPSYKRLYDKIISIDKFIPGKDQICKNLITDDIKKAYKNMKNTSLSTVLTTNL